MRFREIRVIKPSRKPRPRFTLPPTGKEGKEENRCPSDRSLHISAFSAFGKNDEREPSPRGFANRHIGNLSVQRNRTIAGLQNDLGPASASILSFQVRIADSVEVFFRESAENQNLFAGMAIRKNLEAGRARQVRVMPEAALETSMSSFVDAEKRSYDIAVAIVNLHFAAGFFPQKRRSDWSVSSGCRRSGNLKIAGAGFQMAAELRKREIGCAWNERTPFATLSAVIGPKKLAMRESARRWLSDAYFRRRARNFTLPLCLKLSWCLVGVQSRRRPRCCGLRCRQSRW